MSTKAKYILLGLLIFVSTVVAIPATVMTIVNQNRVAMGVYYGPERLSGMSHEQVRAFFHDLAAKKLGQKALILTYNNKSWSYSSEDIKLSIAADEAAEAAWRVGHDPDKNLVTNLADQLESASARKNIDLEVSYDKDIVADKLAQISREIDIAPVNATLSLQADGSIKLQPGRNGAAVPQQELLDKIEHYFSELHIPLRLAITPEVKAPAVSRGDLAQVDTVLGTYTTSYYPGDRGSNIELAAGRLNGQLVRTGVVLQG